MVRAVHDHTGAIVLVDSCWNRIGTHDGRFCPRLATYSHYLSCPVFEERAATLLGHALSDADLEATARAHRMTVPLRALEHVSTELAVLVFRVTDEWLTLPATTLRQIDTPHAIHTLPHRHSRVVLGLVNIRRTLIVTMSLGELLGLDRTSSECAGRNDYAWLLVAAHHDRPAVFPADEVEGVLHLPTTTLLPVLSMLMHATTAHARGVLAWRDVTIGLLDTDCVFDSIARNLR